LRDMPRPGVVVFSKLFWPEGGGAELATYIIVRDILSKHFDVTVVSGTRKPSSDILKCCKYIHWSVLESRYKPVEWLRIFPSLQTLKRLVKDADVVYIPSHTLIPLTVIVKRVKPDEKIVIHLHNYQPLTFTSVVLAGREPDLATDILVELGESGSLFRAIASGIGHYINILNRIALRYADRVICVSRRQCELVEKYVPEVRGRTTVVYNPLPPMPSIERDPDETPTLLYLGGGSYIKGFHIAVKVLAEILAKHDCRVYVTYGRSIRPEQVELLERLSKKFNGRLKALGRLPYEELFKLYSKAWALLFPSICEEPLPYAVLEAAATGTIPVAFNFGGVPEVVRGTSMKSFLCRPSDLSCMIEKLEYLESLAINELFEMGQELMDAVLKRFSLNVIEERIVKLFNSVT